MRTLYRLLLQLHPPAFRERYAAEMLWIFDQTEDGLETVRLLGDGVVSLLRQWTVRRVPGDAHSSRAAQAGAAPMFLVSARRPPAGRVLFSGALCSLLMFGAVGSVIARGGRQGFAVMPHAEAARSRPLSFLAMAALPQAATADEPGSISGLVIDGMTQQPLAGASVLVLGRGIRLEATTDSQGRYRIQHVPAGARAVLVAPPGGTDSTARRSVTLGSGEDLKSIDFHLFPNASVSGLVTDQNDEPLEGIEVTFLRREYDMGGIRYVRTGVTRTNDLGEYRLERRYFAGNVPALLWARRPQTQLQAMSDAPADPAMRREAVESTYFPNGVRPEEGAVIRLARGEQRENVNIQLPRSQSFCVEAQANIAGPAEDTHFLIDTLQPAFGAGRSMAMSSAKNPGRVGRDGRLRICDLPRGEYRLMIYAGNDGPPESLGVAQFAITDEDVKNLQITAQPRTPLSGTTVWASGPPAKPIEETIYVELARLHHGFGGGIRAQPKIPEEFRLQWTVSIGGDLDNPLIDDYRVDIRLLPEGVYVKDVTYGGESVWNETLRLGSKPTGTGIEVLLAHDGGSLRAHAVDDKSEPASDVTVVLIPKKTATHMELADTRLAAITNSRGEASFDSVPPGEYWVLATGDNFMDYAVETIAALFDAKAKAEEINIGPNAAVDIEVEVQRLQR